MYFNKKNIPFSCFCIVICILISTAAKAQSLTLEKDFLTDYLRNKQLIDSTESPYSFTIRPLSLTNNISTLYNTKPIFVKSKWLKGNTSLLPLVFNSTINSHHPVGENLGAMLPTASPQIYFSGGFYFKHNKWELQIQPEIIFSNNKEFETFPHGHFDPIWQSYYRWLNKIDAPEQFGTNSFLKLFPGQSKIQYNFSKNWVANISTENLWWGPGTKNSLIMTNNAAGFLHLSLQTNKPLKTKWGTLEAQLIFGKLDNSGIFPPDTNRVMNTAFLYEPKVNQWRYMTGYTLSFQPKLFPGLFLGVAKSTTIYQNNIRGPLDLVPLSGWLVSKSEKFNQKFSLGSIFFRYVLKESNAEVYAEYGRNDRGASIVNLITDDHYNRGYVVGLRKISGKNSHNTRFEVTAEITQLDATKANEIYTASSWYINENVRHGYTQLGKVIGAGIGPGSNSQSIDISMLKGKAKFGILLERLVHNNDFYYNAYYPAKYWKRHWVDMNALYHAYFEFKKHYFVKAQVGVTRSLNYEWRETLVESLILGNGYDPINIHGNLMVVYHW